MARNVVHNLLTIPQLSRVWTLGGLQALKLDHTPSVPEYRIQKGHASLRPTSKLQIRSVSPARLAGLLGGQNHQALIQKENGGPVYMI